MSRRLLTQQRSKIRTACRERRFPSRQPPLPGEPTHSDARRNHKHRRCFWNARTGHSTRAARGCAPTRTSVVLRSDALSQPKNEAYRRSQGSSRCFRQRPCHRRTARRGRGEVGPSWPGGTTPRASPGAHSRSGARDCLGPSHRCAWGTHALRPRAYPTSKASPFNRKRSRTVSSHPVTKGPRGHRRGGKPSASVPSGCCVCTHTT